MAYEDLLDHWKEHGIDPPQRIVVCAACRVGRLIYCGARHWDEIMHNQAKAADIGGHAEQGFIDQFGSFLTRKEAMKIVRESGQPFDKERNGGSGDELYSEGLY